MFISNTDISTNMKRRGEHTNQTKTTETTVGYIFHYQTSRGLSNIKMLTQTIAHLTIVYLPLGSQNRKQVQEEQYMNITKHHYKVIMCTCA